VFELRALHLLGRLSPTLATPSDLFVFVVLGIGSLIYAQASLDHNPTIHNSHIPGMTGVCHHAQLLLVKMGGSQELFSWSGLKP
jgi:hypothetical protein